MAKTVFDLTEEEFKERIKPTADASIKAHFDSNTYIVYFDEELCDDDMLIREYKDRLELVTLDDKGIATLIKVYPKSKDGLF